MKDFFDTWKFKILVAVAVFLVGIMAYAGANGRLTAAPQELLGVVLMPFQKVTSALSGGIGSVWEKYTSIDEVMEQNEQLEAENAELRQQIVDYDRIKAENEAYKALARIQDSNTEGLSDRHGGGSRHHQLQGDDHSAPQLQRCGRGIPHAGKRHYQWQHRLCR